MLILQTAYETSQPELVCMCLDVVGKYVSWIEITLVANDRFVPVLLRFLNQPLLRESAADCIYEVISKGMDPMAKLRLVESFFTVLDGAGVLNPPEVSLTLTSITLMGLPSHVESGSDTNVER